MGNRANSARKAKVSSKRASTPELRANKLAKPAAKIGDKVPAKAAPKPGEPVELNSFTEALAYLASRVNVEAARPASIDVGRVFKLDRMNALMRQLGDPQTNYRVVHVAGSKGKGSVCEMTAACLAECGMAVGLYTSPHMVDHTERIRINGIPVSPQVFTGLIAKVATAAATLPAPLGEATAFELLTAAAFVHFANEAVDIAVIEVGMGGRLDATNIVQPDVTAITAIQLEHTQFLGNTLELIAAHKAGIIKKGAPAISVPQSEAVLGVLKSAADLVGTPLSVLGREIEFTYRFEASAELGPHARVSVSSERSNFEHLAVPLKGEHQAYNCGLALAVLDALRAKGLTLPEARVASGLATTPSNGRLELIHTQPRIFADGAHNPESVQNLVKALGAQVRSDSMVCVFGCAADKDIVGMLTSISLGADKVIFTRAEGSERAADPRDLLRKFNEISGKMAQTAPSVKDALNMAARAVNRDDLILVTGSFAVAGEAKRLLLAKARIAAAQAATQSGSASDSKRPNGSPQTGSGTIREVKPMGASGPKRTKPKKA